MTRRVAYLAGSIGGLTYEEATSTRNAVKEQLAEIGWDTLDPMRAKEILSTAGPINEREAKMLLGGVQNGAIIERDVDDVRRSDIILILSGDHASWGSAFEWSLAHFMFRKPVIVLAPKGSLAREHPWCQNMCSYFAETVEEMVDFIDRWYDRGYVLE